MQYEVTTSTLNVEISDKSSLALGANINLIKAGELEVEEAVKKSIEIFNDNAAIKQAEVNAAASEARDWAIKTDGKVDDEDYSAKYYAQQAADVSYNGVIATGGTTKRSLQDHFGDILNVKDFGAKGDGVTDDTAAFQTANQTGKTVFVPFGSYNLSTIIYGDFTTDTAITFTNKKIYVKNINYEGNNLRKDILTKLDYEFPGYSTASSLLGNTLGAKCCAYVINPNTNERYLFVGYGISHAVGAVIVGYNLTTDTFIGYNYDTNAAISEGMVVKYNNGFDIYINTTTDAKLYKATFTGNSGAITFTQYGTVETYNKLAYRNGSWLLRTKPLNGSDLKFNMIVTDDEFNTVATITNPRYKYDLLYDYSSADEIEHKIPHKQGIGLLDNSWCFFAGGSSTGQYNKGEENNGVIEYSFEGDFLRSSICNTDEYISIIENIENKTVTLLESEGGFIDESNRVFSLNIVGFSDNTKKIYVIEEFSKAATSFDCSGIFNLAHYGNVLNMLPNVSYPYFYGNKLKNPLTNEDFNTIDDVAQFMRKADVSYIKINDATAYGLVSAAGTNIIDTSITSTAYTLELTNKDRNCVNITVSTARQDVEKVGLASYILLGLSTTPSLRLMSSKVNKIFINGSSDTENIATPSSKPSIEFNGSSEVDIFWKSYYDTTNSFAINRFIDNGADSYWDVGYSAAYKSPNYIRLGTQSVYGSLGYDNGIIISSSSLHKARPSDVSLGTASYKWSEIFADNAVINTSDERLKQDIEDIDERVFRAWEKVDFKQFRFKNAVNEKGENARIHFGLIAQQVKEAFESEGLDGFRYGLLCYDEWGDEFEENEITDKKAEYDEEGNVISPAEVHTEKKLVREAGNAYGIRYGEALALECAYQRWKLEQIEQRLA